MTADPRELHQLLEESQDVQADAIATTREPLDELVAWRHEQHAEVDGTIEVLGNRQFFADHQRSMTASLAGATALTAAGGAALIGLLASPAYANSSPDVQMLQTAASIENLAVSTYKTALTLPYIGGRGQPGGDQVLPGDRVAACAARQGVQRRRGADGRQGAEQA